MVWQTARVFDDSHEEGVLKGVDFSEFSLYFLWMVGSRVFTSVTNFCHEASRRPEAIIRNVVILFYS